jgi:hypothetical protein
MGPGTDIGPAAARQIVKAAGQTHHRRSSRPVSERTEIAKVLRVKVLQVLYKTAAAQHRGAWVMLRPAGRQCCNRVAAKMFAGFKLGQRRRHYRLDLTDAADSTHASIIEV